MAALRVLLPLAICLLLGHQTFAQNDAPCQKSNKKNNAFDIFKYRHILKELPKSLEPEEWKELIKKDNSCNRTRQSFLGLDMLDKVKAVCTKAGGKIYEKNMCISNQNFTFDTVIIQKVTCKILKVIREKKHLILACDRLGNLCLPVHFKANCKNKSPNNNAKSCQAP